jgi:hypothetical protein
MKAEILSQTILTQQDSNVDGLVIGVYYHI